MDCHNDGALSLSPAQILRIRNNLHSFNDSIYQRISWSIVRAVIGYGCFFFFSSIVPKKQSTFLFFTSGEKIPLWAAVLIRPTVMISRPKAVIFYLTSLSMARLIAATDNRNSEDHVSFARYAGAGRQSRASGACRTDVKLVKLR